MAITYNDLYLDLRQKLRLAGVEAYTLAAREIVCYASGKTRQELQRDGRLYVPQDVEVRVGQLTERHLAGEPVAYLIGEWSFYGLDLDINDPADSNVLWDKLDANTQDIWAAAWGSALDPDMTQVYHSSNADGKGTTSNHYNIKDATLDQYMADALKSDNTAYRKSIYKECLEIIIDWAVEIPTYQRQNCFVFSTERINIDSLPQDMTPYWTWINGVDKIELK